MLIKFLKRFSTTALKVVLVLGAVLLVFIIGVKAGKANQTSNDLEVLSLAVEAAQYCSAELSKFDELKSVCNQSSAAACNMKPDDLCRDMCRSLASLSDGSMMLRDAAATVSGDCVCFLVPDL